MTDNLTKIASDLLLGEKYKEMYDAIRDKDRVSARKIERIMDDLLERDRQIAIRVIDIRDRLR